MPETINDTIQIGENREVDYSEEPQLLSDAFT